MSDIPDYKKLNFKCGIEIHQQLSGKKLFCECSTDMKEQKETTLIRRNLRTSSGETGETDIAAKYEAGRARDFVYHSYENEACLVDADCEPPHEINHQALETALSVAKALKMNIPDKLITMRKIVINGSACSSFQRTMVVGTESKDSFIETSHGNVRVTSLCLEEDACKIIKQSGSEVHYSLSRQGIPLLELRTDPDIKNPEHAKETAEKIGLILRSFPNLKRGIGTIRQDVNLSIQNKARIEIKGFQDIRSMPKIIENEVKRLLALKTIVPEVRNANPDFTTTFMRPLPGSARMYPDTDLQQIDSSHFIKLIKPQELLTDKLLSLETDYGLETSIAKEIIRNKIDFPKYVRAYPNIKPATLARIIIETPKDIKARENVTPTINHINQTLSYLSKSQITLEAVPQMLLSLAKNQTINLQDFAPADSSDVEAEIRSLIKKQPDITDNALMGMIMAKYRGKIPGSELIALIKKIRN